ncbi:glycosyltransferase [Spirosoma rhododendri]|uniref:Glycosyltransferase family 4 protein n=1 Tax=Spirosoma rhododendri TaxID=2728024 RepID=A0A7L5DRT6_9BACT|nr:glycosyltransferase [Spirosoma rhododendri]QJD78360.1 glycosyltransferase family 4 protein [Spirosoma rhododendri]
MKKTRILHVSTAHPPTDPRLINRVIPSLTADYDLIALLPAVPKTEGPANARTIWLPYSQRLPVRLLLAHPLVLYYALRLRPSLLHIYDPELLPVSRLIQWLLGIPVMYEVHENLYRKLDQKRRLQGNWLVQQFLRFDAMAQRHFHLIFTEHGYLDTYKNMRHPSVVVYNYPELAFLDTFRRPYMPNPVAPEFFYIGLISFERAFDTLVAALARLKNQVSSFTVHLFGRQTFSDDAMTQLPGFDAVHDNLRFYGYTRQADALPTAAHATAGLALLKPVGDYPESYPTKLFEYMALGLPVITANFPLYRAIVDKHRCGLCVDATDANQIAQALQYLIKHPDDARLMGERGRRAVELEYNWESEAQKLRAFYRTVLQPHRPNKV